MPSPAQSVATGSQFALFWTASWRTAAIAVWVAVSKAVHYLDNHGKVEYLKLGTLMFSQMPYFAVSQRLNLIPFAVQLIIIEEFQDLTPLFLEMAKLVLSNACSHRRRNAPYPRILALGDPKQAITYFQGSMLDAQSSLITTFAMTCLMLWVSRRLSKAVARACNRLINKHPEVFRDNDGVVPQLLYSEDAPEGLHIESGETMRSCAYLFENSKAHFLLRTNSLVRQWAAELLDHDYDYGCLLNGKLITAREQLLQQLTAMESKGINTLDKIVAYVDATSANANKKALRNRIGRIAKQLLQQGVNGNALDSMYHVKNAVCRLHSDVPEWIVSTIHQSKGRENLVTVGIGTASSTPGRQCMPLI